MVEVRGRISGVLQQEPGEKIKSNLFINQTTPDTSKTPTKALKTIIEENMENQKNQDATSDIGFYVSCELGMAFTQRNLNQAIVNYRNFRNCIMVVYDLNKSQYGLNPLMCYRLTEDAINSLYLNDLAKLTSTLVQDSIIENNLKIEEFFEEVEMKIHRSHLLQAFLFDHIQPNIPSFNPKMFALGCDSSMLTHLQYQQGEKSQKLVEEMLRIESSHKRMMQQAKRNNRKLQQQIISNKEKTVKGSVADKEEREALEGVKIADDTDSKTGLVLIAN